jgi:molybdenum cofactor cytidylyltransferase
MNQAKIVPILLAGGPSRGLPFPKALAPFGGRTALEIALANCAAVRGLSTPLVVLGSAAARVAPRVPKGIRMVVNQRWRAGQLTSLLAGLRRMPAGNAFLLYPVDHPLITPDLLRRLVRAYRQKNQAQEIVLPIFRGRVGHPAVFSPSMRQELRRAQTAREVVYRDPRRLRKVKVRTPAIWMDFATPASYRRCLRAFLRQQDS